MKKLEKEMLDPIVAHIVKLFQENEIKGEDLNEDEGMHWMSMRNLLVRVLQMKATIEMEEKLGIF